MPEHHILLFDILGKDYVTQMKYFFQRYHYCSDL